MDQCMDSRTEAEADYDEAYWDFVEATDRRYYASPRALRQALREAGGDWAQVLTTRQLTTALPPEAWGGHATVGSWLSDGANASDVRTIFWVAAAPREETR